MLLGKPIARDCVAITIGGTMAVEIFDLLKIAHEEGKIVWDFDTVRDYQTVNGVKATGGSLNGPGAVVVGGMVFVNSGYARLGTIPGNVLLAFSVDGK